MLTRDPFRHVGAGHGRLPRRIVRRVIAGTIGAGILAGAALLATQTAHAAIRTETGAMVAHAATITADRFTPSPVPITPPHARPRSRYADRLLCGQFRRFDAAGIPGPGILRDLARAGSIAGTPFERAAAVLVMRVVAGETFYAADTRLQRMCGQD